MKYVTYPINIKYREAYYPPRCRKPRYRDAKRIYRARVRSITKEEAPVAFFLSDYHSRSEGRVKIRLYKGQLYCLETWQRYGPGTEQCPWDRKFKGYGPLTAAQLHLNIWQTCGTYEEKRKHYREQAAKRLIIDNLVWIRCGEPMYEINTFGLGHNHGGTALFVQTEYNPNIGRSRYFNALQADEAVAAMNTIAARRGDTNSVGKYGKMIDVLIPSCVKRNPQKEHGDGDAFQNTLEKITESAGSPIEAGLLAIMAATKA